MKEFVEKLIERLEGLKCEYTKPSDIVWNHAVNMCISEVLAEEYNSSKSSGLSEPYKPEEKTKFSNEELDAIMDKILDGNQEPKTRIEHIRSMSVEEMADKILASEISTTLDFCQNFCGECENIPESECKKCLIQWLNSTGQQKTIPTEYFEERFGRVI